MKVVTLRISEYLPAELKGVTPADPIVIGIHDATLSLRQRVVRFKLGKTE